MDISKASNFERFVADLLGRDGQRVAQLFSQELAAKGFFDLSDTPEFASLGQRFGFTSGSSTHADRLAAIRRLWQEAGRLVDPHTADAVHVASRSGLSGPVVVAETALPVKFSDTIAQAVGFAPPLPARFAHLSEAPRHVVDLPNDVAELKRWLERWLAEGETP